MDGRCQIVWMKDQKLQKPDPVSFTFISWGEIGSLDVITVEAPELFMSYKPSCSVFMHSSFVSFTFDLLLDFRLCER